MRKNHVVGFVVVFVVALVVVACSSRGEGKPVLLPAEAQHSILVIDGQENDIRVKGIDLDRQIKALEKQFIDLEKQKTDIEVAAMKSMRIDPETHMVDPANLAIVPKPASVTDKKK